MNPNARNPMLWVIATFALALLPQVLRMPPAVALFALAPLAWRVAAEVRGWQPLPAMLRHVLTVLALLALFLSYGDLSGRRAAVSLLAVMLSLKLIECYRIRDARLVVSFSLFLCATQFLFGQKIGMPVYGVAVTLLALATLVRLQRVEAWATRGAPPRPRLSPLAELGFSLRLLALAVPAGLAFFLLFPRFATPLWGIPETTLDSKSGLSDSMAPGDIQKLFMDDSPAFRVTFEGPVPPPNERYWRGPVFWRFDGRAWTDSFYSRNLPADPVPASDAPGVYRYEVQMEPNERKWLFALDYPAIEPPDSRITVDFQILRRDPVLQLYPYRMVSNPDFRDSPLKLPAELTFNALELPEGSNPGTRTMMEEWRRQSPNPSALVDRAYRHFGEDPFRYTLDAPVLGEHSVDEFLFESRAGFCEHYASAFTVMMRMAGIPARVVTGYMGGYYNPLGEYLLVRQSDAHAWAEVWLQGQGWIAVDPTAAVSPARIDRGSLGAVPEPRFWMDVPWLRDMKNSVDVVQQRWNDWVIEYGARQQANLLAPLGLGAVTPTSLVLILALVLGLVGFIVVPLVLRIRGPSEKDPARRAWLRFLGRLNEAGYSASLAKGPLELAADAAARLPAHREGIIAISELYARCRFSANPPAVSELEQAVHGFRPEK
jgi:transglutaminase-like putative cysteine protease